MITGPLLGPVDVRQIGREVRCVALGFILERGDEPYRFAYDTANELSVLKISKKSLSEKVRDPDRFCAKIIDAPNQTGSYGDACRRMFQFYAAGMAGAPDPFEVGKVIHHAVTTDQPQLRYPVSWGGRELVDGRPS